MPFFNLDIWPQWKILLKQFVSATPLKTLKRISWNFLVMKDIMFRCAYPLEMLIQFFLSELSPFWTYKFDQVERYYWNNWMKNTNVPNVPYMFYTFCTYKIYEIILLYFPGVNWHLWLIYQLNTLWKKDKILVFVCLIKISCFILVKKILVLIHYDCVSFITNI